MQLSVVVPAHNEEQTLGAQLDALLAQAPDADWEVLVVDNRSSDGTADLVLRYASMSDRVRLVRAHERADRSYALNVGFSEALASKIAVCDGDDIVSPGWIEAMTYGLDCFEVVTGPNELDALNSPWLASSRGRSADMPSSEFWGIFPMIRGNNFGVRRETWDSVGGLDEEYRFCEDVEFSFRCWRQGVEIVGIAEASVHYRYRETPQALWRQGIGYGAGRPHIKRLMADHGCPTPPAFGGWKSWALLVMRLPTLVRREGRATWVWIAANRIGHVIGSVRYRTLMV